MKNYLTKIWNKIAFEIAASDLIYPPADVKAAMEHQGWAFETQIIMGPPVYYHSGVTFATTIRTPGGEDVQGSPENYERYRKARRETAAKVYGIGPT